MNLDKSTQTSQLYSTHGLPRWTSEVLPRGVIYNALSEICAWKQLLSKDVIKFENSVLLKYYPPPKKALEGSMKCRLSLKVKVAQLCPTLCNPMVYTVYGILQARIPEWVAFSFSRGSPQPRDRTQVSHIAGGQILYQLSH